MLSKLIDICLMTVKWPLAFSSIIILPFAVMEFFGSDVIGMLLSTEFTILIGLIGLDGVVLGLFQSFSVTFRHFPSFSVILRRSPSLSAENCVSSCVFATWTV